MAFMSNNHGFYVYTTKDIENGEWKKYTSKGWYHDPGLFFDEGAMYVLSASGGTCTLQQLRLNDETGTIETWARQESCLLQRAGPCGRVPMFIKSETIITCASLHLRRVSGCGRRFATVRRIYLTETGRNR